MPIKPGTTETFYPDALKNVSSSSIQMIKSDPRGMKFVQGKTEKANVNPTIKDIGSHIIRFFGSSQEGTKYMQEVLIKVAEYDIYKEVIANIVKITQGGTVVIEFNQPMIIPGNISSFNNESMWLKIANTKNPNRESQVKFKWKATNFTGKTLYLNINFTKPFIVSVPVRNDILIIFLGPR